MCLLPRAQHRGFPSRMRPLAERAPGHHHRLSKQLQDQNDNVIAFFRPTRPQRYNIGEVHGELHFVRSAGAGVVVRATSLTSATMAWRR